MKQEIAGLPSELPDNPSVARTSHVMKAAAALMEDALVPLVWGSAEACLRSVIVELRKRALLLEKQADELASGWHAQDSLGDCLRAIQEVARHSDR